MNLAKTFAPSAEKGGWMPIDQIRRSLTTVEETAKEKAQRALDRANRAEEIQQADKTVKGLTRRLDHGVWKLVDATT